MTDFLGAALSLAMIAAAVLAVFGVRLMRRGGDDRRRGGLMIAAAAVLVANVLILAA